MSEKNSDLEAVATALGSVISSLRAARSKETDPDKITAINNELIETSHRVTMVGALLFHRRTTAITAAAQKVEDATGRVQQEIAKLDKINTFVKTISGFLGLVDKVVDLAKMAAI